MKSKELVPCRKSYYKPRLCIKKQRHHFADKVSSRQSSGSSYSHVQMWELNHNEGWVLKNWCFWTVVLDFSNTLQLFSSFSNSSLESPLDYKGLKPAHPKGNQPRIFIGRTDSEAEAPILWPPDAKSWLIRKDPDTGKDWRHKNKGMTEDEMVGWHHWLSGHVFEQALGDGDGQGELVCCSPWSGKESDTTEQLRDNK